MKCLDCRTEMINKGVYKFDSEESKRGLLGKLLDVEDHLKFEIHVCPVCEEVRMKYKGSKMKID